MSTTTQATNEDKTGGFVPRAQKLAEQRLKKRPGWIPAEEVGMKPVEGGDIFEMRVTNQQFLQQLWLDYAGYSWHKNDDGKYGLSKISDDTFRPLMTPRGAKLITGYLKMLNNTSVLGNIKNEEMIVSRKHIWHGVAGVLADNPDDFLMTYAEKKAFMAFCMAYVNGQLSRSVKGFEANNLNTRIEEQRGEHSVVQSSGDSKGWFGFGKSKSGGMRR